MARPSRVVVTMPPDLSFIGYDLATMLAALRDWPMRLDVNAVPDRSALLESLIEATRETGLEHLLQPNDALIVTMGGSAALGGFTPSAVLGGSSAPAGAGLVEDMVAIVDAPSLKLVIGPHEPAPTVTALDLPYRVVTSPLAPSRWRHATSPVTHGRRTELWHTRL